GTKPAESISVSGIAKCSSSAILPCMVSSLVCRSILPLRREPERHLPVHGPHRIPVHADVTADCVRIAPGALHRIRQIEPLPAGRSIQRLGSANGEADRERLSATAEDSFLDG